MARAPGHKAYLRDRSEWDEAGDFAAIRFTPILFPASCIAVY
jgi:hypothetical protein